MSLTLCKLISSYFMSLVYSEFDHVDTKKFFLIARRKIFKPYSVKGKYVVGDVNSMHYSRHMLPKKDVLCWSCGAHMWLYEKVGGSQKNPILSMCCAKGKITMVPIKPLPSFC